MKIHHLAKAPSILNNYLNQLRDQEIQKDSMRFRRNLERIGEILSYELSKHLHFQEEDIVTPLGVKHAQNLQDKIVICSVLRAGLPLHQGILNYFDWVENAFISAYRYHTSDTEFEIIVEYLASPDLDKKVLILADPMLASGHSLVATFEALTKVGLPKEIHLVTAIASQEGVDYIAKHFPPETRLWVGDIDPELNDYAYIVPGLGDAGDLAFGEKLQK
ncbi:uracil phosphoribosyltransferase [Robertkochia sediminum]|uniref:uracil phosphoribosyltransferase n=1 Tax=Robertkochia sediminum TaxID=2785326 RepID=UPI001933AC66|nr:uracil phosphoribosyltransferase [Robertkochia sediminum]MBL7471767.1 uracil phosphoribosyltransferase [Robertkochia sediminum]